MEAHVRLLRVPLSSRTLSISLAALALAAAAAAPARAQARRLLASDDPEAQLMGYYAAALYFSPAGVPGTGTSIGASLGVVPFLSADQRRVAFGGTKYEDSNRCPVVPELRAAHGGRLFAFEGALIPPVPVCGVTAALVSGAVSTRLPLSLRVQALFRGSVTYGQLAAAITCSANDVANPADQVCYRGTPSDDKVRPLSLGLEAGLLRVASRRLPLDLYALAGVRREQVDFDVNFENPNLIIATGTFADHGRLRTTLTRLHVAAGGSRRLGERLRAGAEWFWAPGAMSTVRASLLWSLHGSTGK